MDFHKEQTLVIIKPDGIQRSLIGEVIGRLERVGLKLVALDFMIPDEDKIRSHYILHKDWFKNVGAKALKVYAEKGIEVEENDPVKRGEKILETLVKYMSSGPVAVMVWQGAHAVQIVRKLVGSTEPLSSEVGTIRGDYVLDSYEMSDLDQRSVRNVVHASGSVQEAQQEIAHWFKPEEIIKYRLVQEQILYDVNLDGIIE